MCYLKIKKHKLNNWYSEYNDLAATYKKDLIKY